MSINEPKIQVVHLYPTVKRTLLREFSSWNWKNVPGNRRGRDENISTAYFAKISFFHFGFLLFNEGLVMKAWPNEMLKYIVSAAFHKYLVFWSTFTFTLLSIALWLIGFFLSLHYLLFV